MIKNFDNWGSDNSKLESNVEGIRFRIDEALDELNFEKVSKITLELQRELTEASSLKSISTFTNFNSINENVKNARAYYLKKVKQELEQKFKESSRNVAKGEEEIDMIDPTILDVESEEGQEAPKKKEKRPFELSKHEEARILNNPDFLFVMDLIKTTPNYAITFVKFKFDQGADRDALKTIFDFVSDQR